MFKKIIQIFKSSKIIEKKKFEFYVLEDFIRRHICNFYEYEKRNLLYLSREKKII